MLRFRWRLRTMLLAIPLIGLFLSVVIPGCDALAHGPYATWYNRRCQRIADEAGLVGRPEEVITPLLGRPTSFYGRPGAVRCTYNYAPFHLVPTAKFQVHCENGIVTAVEQFDD